MLRKFSSFFRSNIQSTSLLSSNIKRTLHYRKLTNYAKSQKENLVINKLAATSQSKTDNENQKNSFVYGLNSA